MFNGRAKPKSRPSVVDRGKFETKADIQRLPKKLRTGRHAIRAGHRETTRATRKRVETEQDRQKVATTTGDETSRAEIRPRTSALLRHRHAKLRLRAVPQRLLIRKSRENLPTSSNPN